ncbi:MAG: PEP/pyruvate-binding domain-containing protein [Propionibacteriaceae bacterium]|nr:PEP/pyruvate-binding domain-containing protein [Propionibacteriaceae bacterium]
MSTPLAQFGGKGANLIALHDAGLPVPDFVIVPTKEYAEFVATSGLAVVIDQESAEPDRDVASEAIRAAFSAARMSHSQQARLTNLLRPVTSAPDRPARSAEGTPESSTAPNHRSTADSTAPNHRDESGTAIASSSTTDVPVAVRSSATAEDLPGLSFAGQQDSFLNVTGIDAIVTAIIDCWSSLWTARAMTYRDRHGINHADVSIAVVVQSMVDADVSGVLFTAHPRTGRRHETVIEAVRGLGDDLVSGRVEPDHHRLDSATGAERERHLTPNGPRLTDAELSTLIALGQEIEDLQGVPQDIEWAMASGQLYVLQARSITSLYPTPASDDPNDVWFSFGAFQGMLQPISPLGQDVLSMMFAGAASVAGVRADWRDLRILARAGERLWIRATPILRTTVGRRVLEVLPAIDPGVAAIMKRLAAEPEFAAHRRFPDPAAGRGLARFLGLILPQVPSTLRHPDRTRAHLEEVAEELVASVRRDLTPLPAAPESPSAPGSGPAPGSVTRAPLAPAVQLAIRAESISHHAHTLLATLLPVFGPIMGPSILMVRELRAIAAKADLPDADQTALTILRSLPGNVTAGMDLALADLAAGLQGDTELRDLLTTTDAAELAAAFMAGTLPPRVQRDIGAFLTAYGMRGVAEIDLGAPRWRDDPTPVFQTLAGYVAAHDQPHPRALHAAGAAAAEQAIERLASAVGPLQARRVRIAAHSVRGMFGARETPKFTIIRCFGIFRDALDDSARELVAAGQLDNPADIYFLRFDELSRAFTEDFREQIAARRTVHEAESRRTRIPRVLVADGRALHEGLGANGDLIGAGVSPGVTEGRVRVVHDPRHARLDRGDILVCRGTDPAWTPLFVTAGGLITEVGGMMTHGSVVARECGIPAIVGVDEATTRLTDGQRIRIDGTSGAIQLL